MIGILPIGRAPNSTKKYVTFFWSMPTKSYQEWRNNGLDPWKERVLNYWPEIEPFITQFTSLDDLAFAEYSDIIMENWHIEKMAFIGDASHCTSPQLGQGANLGIIDAMQLSQCLKVSDNVDMALNYYNKERFGHIRFYQTTSRWLTPFFQSDSIIAAWMRDRVFNIMCNTPYIRTEMIRTLSGMKNGLFSHINPGIWHERYNLNKTL
ncbi:MAG: FAD-dependent monooxygenase [Rickettsiaceae bacterium]|nr:FAD-dependent monooxygenase [Rickettsiaceae bacterium]